MPLTIDDLRKLTPFDQDMITVVISEAGQLNIQLVSSQAGRLWRLLGDVLSDDEKAAE